MGGVSMKGRMYKHIIAHHFPIQSCNQFGHYHHHCHLRGTQGANRKAEWHPGVYVRAFGHLKSHPGSRSVMMNAFSLRTVTNFNEACPVALGVPVDGLLCACHLAARPLPPLHPTPPHPLCSSIPAVGPLLYATAHVPPPLSHPVTPCHTNPSRFHR